ncbi:MAG: DUF3667 domain-containing protein [Ferruginibacter sp.]
MSIICKNCGVHFKGHYCPNCSQKANAGRLKISNVADEFWHNLTHTDKGYMSLLINMIKRPGFVIREYIDVKRKKYFNPYTFYLVTTALLIFVTGLVFKYEDKLYDYRNEYGQYLNAHYNIITLCCMPVLALILMGIFYKRKLNYAEWITFLVFSFGLINFFQIFVQLSYFPLIKFHARASPYTSIIGYVFLFIILIRFIEIKKWWQVLQCIVATILIYYFVELIGQLVALWLWGVPLEKLIQMFKNSF